MWPTCEGFSKIFDKRIIRSRLKDILHRCFFITFSIFVVYLFSMIRPADEEGPSDASFYGDSFLIAAKVLLLVTILVALLPSLLNLIGLFSYNSFDNENVPLKTSPVLSPFICFRTVTKGNYPDLIRRNTEINKNCCLRLGLTNFIIEIVTDKEISIPQDQHITQTVVPPTYSTKSGVLFKARALQYALEDEVNTLNDNDWLVHLDEETLLTENSVCGILNFITEGKYYLGQGLITYANERVVNWMTTLLDFYRVAEDMGKIRFQLKAFHKILLEWKGSFLVCKVCVERSVSFDHGPGSSLAEDTAFALMAASKDYTFNFIEGEMIESSPFTFWDLIMQRRRWFQGIYLITRNPQIPMRIKFVITSIYYCTMFSCLGIVLLNYNTPNTPKFLQLSYTILVLYQFVINVYLYVFGVLKTFSLHPSLGILSFIVCLLLAVPVTIFAGIFTWFVLFFALFSNKMNFYVVQKQNKKDFTPQRRYPNLMKIL